VKTDQAKTYFSDFVRVVQENGEKIGEKITVAAGVCIAAVGEANNAVLDPRLVSRFTSAASNHGVAFADMIEKLPGELRHHGTDAVNSFLKNGDPRGKEWSHIKSQYNSPDLASDAGNAIWEDGTVNNYRNSADMRWDERAYASVDNHIDGFSASAQTSEYWDRATKQSMDAGIYALAFSLIEQLLIHRDELINGTEEERKVLFSIILEKSCVAGCNAITISFILQMVIALVPGLAAILAPLALISIPLLGYKLGKVIAENPSRQEKDLIEMLNYQLEQLKQNIEFTPVCSN